MHLVIILLPLAASLEPFPGQEEEERSVIAYDISETEQEEILDAINDHRRNVKPTASNMLRMVWSKEAAKTAKNWAGTCVPAHSSVEKRVVHGFYCYESILNSDGFKPWKQVILIWYTNFYGILTLYHSLSRLKVANNNNTNFTEQYYKETYTKKYMSSHTQLILYNTYQVGCGKAFCPGNREPFFYVCHFCPMGYVPKQMLMPYKKGLPCGDCPDNCMNNLCTNPCKYVDYAWDCEQMKTHFHCNEAIMVQTCQATCNCNTELIQ